MKHILPNILAVELPLDSTNVFINNVGCLRYSIDNGRQSCCIEPIQMGIYLEKDKHAVLFCSKDVTDWDAHELVDKFEDETWETTMYKNYMSDQDEYILDAIESFNSLLSANSLTGNNYAIIQTPK